ncbi:MAG: hypothetical protein U5K27_05945 [Desulfotignum sp.]|nr:hypothetical protein [Desulfotignum sp.]
MLPAAGARAMAQRGVGASVAAGGHYWSSSENSSIFAQVPVLLSGETPARKHNYRRMDGFSVRCVSE